MAFLNGTSVEITARLQALSRREVGFRADVVKKALDHRSVHVRWAAALALGIAGIGEEALLDRLKTERNEIVLAEIAESLGGVGGEKSLHPLCRLAEDHRSAMVRSYALMGVADIAKKSAVPFMIGRLAAERSTRVKATLRGLLFVLGWKPALLQLVRDIEHGSSQTRRIITSLLDYYRPRRNRRQILVALDSALQRETDPGAWGDLQNLIEVFSPRRRVAAP